MRYADGTEAECGDMVAYSDHEAVVVANADTMLCVPEHAQKFFEFYAICVGNPARAAGPVTGGLVLTKGVGLVAFFSTDAEFALVRRATETTGAKVSVEIRDEWLGFRLEDGT